MMLDGIAKVAPVGVMIIFAVLYFGLMLDVGLFDPMITRLLRLVKGDPVKVALATAVLTMAVSLDGDGATTFLITVSAMLPLYQRLGMDRLVLSGIVALGAGVMNIIPWGGPTVRAMAALKADASVIFNPVVPAMIAGIAWVLFVAFMLGRREKRRLRHHLLGRGRQRRRRRRPGRHRTQSDADGDDESRRCTPRPWRRAADRSGKALAVLVQHGPDGRADHLPADGADAAADPVHPRLRHRPGGQLSRSGRTSRSIWFPTPPASSRSRP